MKSKNVKKFQIELQSIYPKVNTLFKKPYKMEKGILDDGTVLYFINGKLTFFEKDNYVILFLKILLEDIILLPKIVVDMGAVPFIIKGAAVMVPGIVATDEEIEKGDYVVIVDEKHNKPLAIGVALMDSSEISKANKGKSIKNLHFIGDRMWNFVKKLKGN